MASAVVRKGCSVGIIQALLEAQSGAASLVDEETGKLPLALAIESGTSMAVVMALVEALPASLGAAEMASDWP